MPIHLYKLLPQIIKLKDKLASCGAPGNLEKWIGCIEDVANSTEEKIDGLSDLLDADQCDPMYLFYLSTFLGTPVGAAHAPSPVSTSRCAPRKSCSALLYSSFQPCSFAPAASATICTASSKSARRAAFSLSSFKNS